MPDGAVFVGRPSRWGNPFRIISMGTALHRVYDSGGRVPSLSDATDMWITDDLLGAHAFAVRTFELHIGPMGRYQPPQTLTHGSRH